MFGVITVKRSMERIRSRVRIHRHGSQQAKTAYKELTATNADTAWRLGMMEALGIFVPNRNTDKENRR
jgi:ribosomal protein S16